MRRKKFKILREQKFKLSLLAWSLLLLVSVAGLVVDGIIFTINLHNIDLSLNALLSYGKQEWMSGEIREVVHVNMVNNTQQFEEVTYPYLYSTSISRSFEILCIGMFFAFSFGLSFSEILNMVLNKSKEVKRDG